MPTIRRLPEFNDWLAKLRDVRGAVQIARRIERFQAGNPGKTRSVGSDVQEMKIDFGPGYRVYFTYRGAEVVILLCGGDKDSQERDIREAKRLSATV